MIARIAVWIALMAACWPLTSGCAYAEGEREVCRIRIYNTLRGSVQVSCDQGQSFVTVGRVIQPANSTIHSFAAASYVTAGTVAATAVHGLRVKVGQRGIGVGAAQEPLSFSIVPREYATTPTGYGGHLPGNSGIQTDIGAGRTIFREFAPFVGNSVYLQDISGRLSSIPTDYTPRIGDVIVILVEKPDKFPTEIVFENRLNGAVTARYADGTVERITDVLHPVSGIGRYDGTSYTGVGAINTNHGGVITISTAPIYRGKLQEGRGIERRGGFMIQPSNHAKTQGATPPQVMVVGWRDPAGTPMEGRAPLFRGCLSPAFDPASPVNSCRVQVRIDDGDWEDLPPIVGKIGDALESSYLNELFVRKGIKRKVKTGVTAIRILFPSLSPAYLQARLKASERKYSYAMIQLPVIGKTGVVNSVLTINASLRNVDRTMFVSFYIDGELKSMTNSPPFAFDWDTTTVSNGEHEIEVQALDSSGHIVSKSSSRVIVANEKPAD